jgi:hypothetical protein
MGDKKGFSLSGKPKKKGQQRTSSRAGYSRGESGWSYGRELLPPRDENQTLHSLRFLSKQESKRLYFER